MYHFYRSSPWMIDSFFSPIKLERRSMYHFYRSSQWMIDSFFFSRHNARVYLLLLFKRARTLKFSPNKINFDIKKSWKKRCGERIVQFGSKLVRLYPNSDQRLLMTYLSLLPPFRKERNYVLFAAKSSLHLTKFLVNTIHIYGSKIIYYENTFHN
jgi:hypothetical protein